MGRIPTDRRCRYSGGRPAGRASILPECPCLYGIRPPRNLRRKGGDGTGLKESFDAVASGYDAQRRWVIPDFQGFYSAAVGAASLEGKGSSILDIGAGTGLLSGLLLETYPDASIVLLDLSDKMLDVARARFAGRKEVGFIAADYRHADLGGPFDAVCSALSIHHLEREEKRELYGRIHRALGDGGVFVNADEVAGETEEENRRNLIAWDEFLQNGPLGPEGARVIMERRDLLDRMEKLSVQLGWLRDAGFRDVGTVYQNGCFTVFSGRK
ncbi:MAG TPA: class I SAM-dependent methyltransferase [Methanomicrobiales archaeon]|nr:class I SAM-dependent methyltransferase [Methanomicrobiales archaeon]